MTSRKAGPAALSAAVREQIARAIHERYRRNQRDRKPATDPAMKPWDDLAETLKESNRDQAGDIARKVHALGRRVVPVEGKPILATFTPGEIEQLAVLEHERWVAERRAAGWVLGPTRDPERKISPHLVGYDQLAEEVREYDREAVRAIPELLAEAGMELR